MFTSIFNSIAILLSLSTATGILVHDTKIDKATIVLATPLTIATSDTSGRTIDIQTDLHTHVERTSVADSLSAFQADNPRLQPRIFEDKKHLLSRHVSRGHHAFDSYNLPIV
jgi:hypothetical protein